MSEPQGYQDMRSELLSHGYRDAEHPHLKPGQRIRHRGEQYEDAYSKGTGVILAVMEKAPSSWSASWGRRDFELIVLKDKPLFPDMSPLSQLADYHVAPADTPEAHRG